MWFKVKISLWITGSFVKLNAILASLRSFSTDILAIWKLVLHRISYTMKAACAPRKYNGTKLWKLIKMNLSYSMAKHLHFSMGVVNLFQISTVLHPPCPRLCQQKMEANTSVEKQKISTNEVSVKYEKLHSILMVLPLMCIVFVVIWAPIVVGLNALNWFCMKRWTNDVFPTVDFPIVIHLNWIIWSNINSLSRFSWHCDICDAIFNVAFNVYPKNWNEFWFEIKWFELLKNSQRQTIFNWNASIQTKTRRCLINGITHCLDGHFSDWILLLCALCTEWLIFITIAYAIQFEIR